MKHLGSALSLLSLDFVNHCWSMFSSDISGIVKSKASQGQLDCFSGEESLNGDCMIMINHWRSFSGKSEEQEVKKKHRPYMRQRKGRVKLFHKV